MQGSDLHRLNMLGLNMHGLGIREHNFREHDLRAVAHRVTPQTAAICRGLKPVQPAAHAPTTMPARLLWLGSIFSIA